VQRGCSCDPLVRHSREFGCDRGGRYRDEREHERKSTDHSAILSPAAAIRPRIAYGKTIGSTSLGSLFFTSPTRGLTSQQIMSSEG
jgi:hypothetical protein